MKRLVLLASVAIGAFVWAAPAMAQTTVKLQNGTGGYVGCMDTYIDKIAPHDIDTYGGVERIEIRDWNGGTSEKMNVLIMFDVSSIPSAATITSAKLTLYSIRARGQNGDVPVVEKVTSAWNGQTTWSTGVPTVVAAPGVTCPPVDGTYVDEPLTTPPNAPQAYTITGMASLVQGWLASPLLNYGIMISCTTDLNFRFASSEYSDVAAHPVLEITYTVGPPPPPPPTPPTVSVTPPPGTVESSPLTVTGTAAAAAPATVTTVAWTNNTTGQSGTASGTTSWTASIPLANGDNSITITVTDSNGTTATSSFVVRFRDLSQKSGGGHKPCGFGLAGTPTGSFAIAALGLALLLVAVSSRK